jgi:hypothetical protein
MILGVSDLLPNSWPVHRLVISLALHVPPNNGVESAEVNYRPVALDVPPAIGAWRTPDRVSQTCNGNEVVDDVLEIRGRQVV